MDQGQARYSALGTLQPSLAEGRQWKYRTNPLMIADCFLTLFLDLRTISESSLPYVERSLKIWLPSRFQLVPKPLLEGFKDKRFLGRG